MISTGRGSTRINADLTGVDGTRVNADLTSINGRGSPRIFDGTRVTRISQGLTAAGSPRDFNRTRINADLTSINGRGSPRIFDGTRVTRISQGLTGRRFTAGFQPDADQRGSPRISHRLTGRGSPRIFDGTRVTRISQGLTSRESPRLSTGCGSRGSLPDWVRKFESPDVRKSASCRPNFQRIRDDPRPVNPREIRVIRVSPTP